MKNKLPRKYKVIIIFQFVMIVFLFYCLISNYFIESDDKWFKEDSPDKKYSISAYFPNGVSTFGLTKARVRIYNKELKSYSCYLYIDIDSKGSRPNKDNYNLEWHEDYVIITTINSNGKSNSVRVYWEDL